MKNNKYNKIDIAIFTSNRGSNMSSIIDYAKKNKCYYNIKLIIINNKNVKSIDIAKKENIDYYIIEHSNYLDRKSFEMAILEKINKYNCKLICLAGFMRILSEFFINNYQHKIINIHPSLLPSFKGLDAVKQAIDYGVKFTGCTTHFVDKNIDSGKIIMQDIVEVDNNDNYKILSDKILQKEHKIYPLSINKICKDTLLYN